MVLKKFDSILLKMLYLTTVCIIVTQVLGMDSLTSALMTATFPLTVLLWLRSVRQKLTGQDYLIMGIAMLALLSVLIDGGIHNASLNFSYIKKYIMFVMTLMFLQTANRMRIGQDVVRFINTVVDLVTVFLIAMYLLRPAEMQLLEGRVSRYLTFRFTNPNLTALFLTCLYMLEVHRLFTREKWYWKLIHVVMACFLAVFVLETQSRNCLLVLVAVTAVSGWLMFRGKEKLHIGKGAAFLLAVFPTIFVLFYMILDSYQWVQEIFSFLISEGKMLTSRDAIWSRALEHLGESPLLGAYYELSYGTGSFQMHNSHLDTACSYGIPVLILVCVLLSKHLYQNGRRYTDKGSFIYMLGFGCAIMMGNGEAALFSGGLAIYVLVGSFLLLANRAGEEGENRLC